MESKTRNRAAVLLFLVSAAGGCKEFQPASPTAPEGAKSPGESATVVVASNAQTGVCDAPAPSGATLVVTPASVTLQPRQNYYFAAALNGTSVTSQAAWSSSNEAVVKKQTGAGAGPSQFVGVAAGTADVTATCGGLSASSAVTVQGSGGGPPPPPGPGELIVTPASVTLQVSQNYNWSATRNGTNVTGQAVWSSSDAAVLKKVTGGGSQPSQFVGVAAGTATVTASYQGKFGSSAVVVQGTQPPPGSAPFIVSLSPTFGPVGTLVTIAGARFMPAGNEIHFTRPGFPDGGVRADSPNGTTLRFNVPEAISACDFVIEPPVCGAPTFEVVPGPYTVFVRNANGTSNSRTFTVTDGTPPGQATLRIAPASKTLIVGQNFWFAGYYDADGPGPQGEQNVSWSGKAVWASANPAVAAIQNQFGQFIGRGPGVTAITATYQDVTATASITVVP